ARKSAVTIRISTISKTFYDFLVDTNVALSEFYWTAIICFLKWRDNHRGYPSLIIDLSYLKETLI
ncbi:MAG: hypothetical protein K2L32_05160, partial [Muribaculaceae bacterium]|nr:hypothetical protein [Muribaculaceae bacterium]